MEKIEIPWKTPEDRYKFQALSLSIEEVIGDMRQDLHEVMGRVTIDFNHLDEQITSAIIKLVGTNEEIGHILTCELSFKNKLNLLGSLFNYYKDTHLFNSLFDDVEETFKELLKACFRCEEFRNKLLHSNFYIEYNPDKSIRRVKKTAKASKGLVRQNELVDLGHILEVADYMYETGENVEEFFFVFEAKK